MRMVYSCAAFCCALLAACAGPTDVGTDLLNKGDYIGAEQQLLAGTREQCAIAGVAWNNLGVLYLRQARGHEAVNAFTMGARCGNAVARATLVRNGWPVPAPDLEAAANEAARQNAEAALRGFTEGVESRRQSYSPPAFPDPITCRSQRSGNAVRTDCY